MRDPNLKTVPPEALARACQHAWETSTRDGMVLETLMETAIRNRECRLLEVDDLWRAGTVVLSLKIRPEIAKNGRPRTIPLTATYRAKARAYITQDLGISGDDDDNSPLFPSRKGRLHLTRKGLCDLVRRHLAAAGIDGTPHMLRHTAATELIRVCNARVVQLLLGHKRLETVQIYTHPTDEDLRTAIEARRRRMAAPPTIPEDVPALPAPDSA